MYAPKGKTWQYDLKRNEETSWALVTIHSDGRIQIMSDYGNWSYWFGAPGMEMRQFCLRLENDPQYLAKKLDHMEFFDGRATRSLILEKITEENSGLPKKQCKKEIELLMEFPEFSGEEDFREWARRTTLEYPPGFFCTRLNPRVVFFAEKVWPRVCSLIRDELLKEDSRHRHAFWGRRRVAT